MDNYLVIITTALVVSQIIRVVQNAMQLRRQKRMMNARFDRLDDVTSEDLRLQKEAYRLIVDRLKGENSDA